jgi:uncharacterized protein YfaS (alpha-2-macroglobulin family)
MFIDWPSWAGKSPKGNEGATMLNLTSDKSEYKVGEEVKLQIPSAKEGKVLISIESGTKVLQTTWIDTKNGVTDYSIQSNRSDDTKCLCSCNIIATTW